MARRRGRRRVRGVTAASKSDVSPLPPAERTYAAWVRTGLVSLASGVGAKSLLSHLLPGWLIGLTGSVLVLFSAFCFGAAVWRQLKPGPPPPEPDARQLPAPLLLLVNGFLVLVALASLVGIWFSHAPS